MTPVSILDPIEVNHARVGPRQLKDPRSREFAIQTLYALKLYLDSKEADEERVKKELRVIQENRHWEVIGYPSLRSYLKGEIGTAKLAGIVKPVSGLDALRRAWGRASEDDRREFLTLVESADAFGIR